VTVPATVVAPTSAGRWLFQQQYETNPIFCFGQLNVTYARAKARQAAKMQISGVNSKQENNEIINYLNKNKLINCSLKLFLIHFPHFCPQIPKIGERIPPPRVVIALP
jgi:hypothetical protein